MPLRISFTSSSRSLSTDALKMSLRRAFDGFPPLAVCSAPEDSLFFLHFVGFRTRLCVLSTLHLLFYIIFPCFASLIGCKKASNTSNCRSFRRKTASGCINNTLFAPQSARGLRSRARNPLLAGKAAMVASPASWSRPSGATQHRWWIEQLGGASEDARSLGAGRFAGATLLVFFL